MRDKKRDRTQKKACKAWRANIGEGNDVTSDPYGNHSRSNFGMLDGQNSLLISDKIDPITKAKENLCLFNCIYQSLRTQALRDMFSANNPAEPTKAFVELSAGETEFKSGKVINREKDGYVTRDIDRYRIFIFEKFGVKFVFKKLNSYTADHLFKQLFVRPLRDGDEFTYVLMGYTLPSVEKKNMKERFEKLRNDLICTKYLHLSGEEQRIAVEKDLINFYQDHQDEMKTIRKRYQTGKQEHGISIGVEKDKSIWLYDNGNHTRKSVTSVAHVAPYLFLYFKTMLIRTNV
jgi:hypothetical protein